MKTVPLAVLCLSLVLGGGGTSSLAGGTEAWAGGTETWAGGTDMWAAGTAAAQDESRSASPRSYKIPVSESRIGFRFKLRAPADNGIITRRSTNGRERKRCAMQPNQPWHVAWNRRRKSIRNAIQRRKPTRVNYPRLIIDDSVVNRGKRIASLYARENIDVNKYIQPKADQIKKLSENILLAMRGNNVSNSSKAGSNSLNHDSSSVLYALPFGSRYKLSAPDYVAPILLKLVNSKGDQSVGKRLGVAQNVLRQSNENGRDKLFQSYRQENTKENVPKIRRQLPIGMYNDTTSTLKMMSEDVSTEITGHGPILYSLFDTIQAILPIKIAMPLNNEISNIMNASITSTRQTTDSPVPLGINGRNWPRTAQRIQRRTFGASEETNIALDESIADALRAVIDTVLDVVETIYYGDGKPIMRLGNSRNTHFTDGDDLSLENRSDRRMKPLLRPVINGILDRLSQLRSDIAVYREENKRIKLEQQGDLHSSKYGPKRTFARSLENNKFSVRDKSNSNSSEVETENQDDVLPNNFGKLKKDTFYKLAIELSNALSNILLDYEKTSKVDTENKTDSAFITTNANISHEKQITEEIDLFKSNDTNMEPKDMEQDNTVHKPSEYRDGISSLPNRLGVSATETLGPIMIIDSHVEPNSKENIDGSDTVSSNGSISLLGIPIVPGKNESKPFKGDGTTIEAIDNDYVVENPTTNHENSSFLLGIPIVSRMEKPLAFLNEDSYTKPKGEDFIVEQAVALPDSISILMGTPRMLGPFEIEDANMKEKFHNNSVKKPEEQPTDINSHLSVIDDPRDVMPLLGIPRESENEELGRPKNRGIAEEPIGQNNTGHIQKLLDEGSMPILGIPTVSDNGELVSFQSEEKNIKSKDNDTRENKTETKYQNNEVQIQTAQSEDNSSVIGSPRYSVYDELKTFNTISKQKDQADTVPKQTTSPEEKSSLIGIPRKSEHEEQISFTSDDVNKEQKYQNNAPQENIEQSKVRSSLLGITGPSEFELLGPVETESTNVEPEHQDSTLLRQTAHPESNSSFLGLARELGSFKSDETNTAPNQQDHSHKMLAAKFEGRSSLLDIPVESENVELRPMKSEEPIMEPKYHSDMQQQQKAKSESDSSLLGTPRESGYDYLGLLKTEGLSVEPKDQYNILLGTSEQPKDSSSPFSVQNEYENEALGSLATEERNTESKYQNNIPVIHESELIRNDESNAGAKHKEVPLQSPAKTDDYILELSGEDPHTIQKGFTKSNINYSTDLLTGKPDTFTSAETLMGNNTDKVVLLKDIKGFEGLGLVKEQLQEETNIGVQPHTTNDSLLTDIVVQGSNNGTDSLLSKPALRDQIIDAFNEFVDTYIDYKMSEKTEPTNNLKQNNMTHKLNNISDERTNTFRKNQALKNLVETVTLGINEEVFPKSDRDNDATNQEVLRKSNDHMENGKATKSIKGKIDNILSTVKTDELPQLFKIAIKFLLEPFGLSGKLENDSDTNNTLLESVDSISNKEMKLDFRQINHSIVTDEGLVLKTPEPLKSVNTINDKDILGGIRANTTAHPKLDKGWGKTVTNIGKEILRTYFNLTHKEYERQDNSSREEGNNSLKSFHTKEMEQLSQPKLYEWEAGGRANIRPDPCTAHPVTHLCIPLHSAQAVPTVSHVMNGQLYLEQNDEKIPLMLNYGMFRTTVPNVVPSFRKDDPIDKAEGLPRVPIALALTGHDNAKANLDIEDYSHSELNNTPDKEKSVVLSSDTGDLYAENSSKNKDAVKWGNKRRATTEGAKMDANGQFNSKDGRNHYATEINNETTNRENYYFLKGKPTSSQNKVESDNKVVNYFSSDSNRKTITASNCYLANSKPYNKNIILGESQEEMENSNGTLTEPAYGDVSKSSRRVKVNLELKDLTKEDSEDSRAVINASDEIVGNHGAVGEISYIGSLKQLDKDEKSVSTNEKTEILRENGKTKQSVSEYKLISLSENVANKTENQTFNLITQKQLQPYGNQEIPSEVQSKREAVETNRNIDFIIFNETQKSITEPVPLSESIGNVLTNSNKDFHLNSTTRGNQHNVANNNKKSRHSGGMKPKRDCRIKTVDNCEESQIINRLKEMYMPQTQNKVGTETSTQSDSMSSDLKDESDLTTIQDNDLKHETIGNCRTKQFENQGRELEGYAIDATENVSGKRRSVNSIEYTISRRMVIITEILRAIKDWLILAG